MRSLSRITATFVVAVFALSIIPTALPAQQMMYGGRHRMYSGTPSASQMPVLRKYPLSEHQKRQIATIHVQSQVQMRSVQSNPRLTARQKTDMIQRIENQERMRIFGVLDRNQRQELRERMPSYGHVR